MSFLIYDLSFLVLFILFMAIFLSIKKKNLKREGIFMLLYRTSVGIKFIDYVGKKHKKTLKILSYLVVGMGYILMIISIYFLIQMVFLFTNSSFVKLVKIPPLMPLVPYLPELFKINWLPNFYFSYWIIAIAMVAIFHEGFHGIFARYNGIKIKSTGFGFFWPLLSLLFFVEQDDKGMQKKKIFPQLTVLAGGVFANILLAILFALLMMGFSSLAYSPSGASFNDYTYNLGSADFLNEALILNNSLSVDGINLTQIKINNLSYFILPQYLNKSLIDNQTLIPLYQDQPAIRNNLRGAIIEINKIEIKTSTQLSEELKKYNPGDKIELKTVEFDNDGNRDIFNYSLTLGKDYQNESRGVLGIANANIKPSRLIGFLSNIMNSFRESFTVYQPKGNYDLTIFVYNLLWWLLLINVSVGIFNMIPAGIFDGGRFFYLTILAITKNKKIAEKSFKFVSGLIIFIFLLLMILWLFGILR